MTIMQNYQHGQFCWVDLMAHDVPKAREFYQQFLGWQAESMDTQGGPAYDIFFFNNKRVAGLGELDTESKNQGVPPIWNSYINVDDVRATTEKAQALGATIIMPPMTAVDAGEMAIIQDPTGAIISLWQKINHFGADLVNSPSSFCWNELMTRDLDAAQKFYGELLGWTFKAMPESPNGYVSIMLNGESAGGMMAITEEYGDMPAHWSIYLTVEDIEQACKRLQSLKGKVHVAPFPIPEVGTMAIVEDDQGSHFNIIQLDQIPD